MSELNSVIVGTQPHFLSLNRNQTPFFLLERESQDQDHRIASMGTLQSWRRVYGAVKDTTKVGLAHVNSDYAVIPPFDSSLFS